MRRPIRFMMEWRQWQRGQVVDTIDYGVADALVSRRVAEWAGDSPEEKHPQAFLSKRRKKRA